MNDFQAYILHTNRPDLLSKAVASVRDLRGSLNIIDNSQRGLQEVFPSINIMRPPVPLTAIQSLNLALTDSRRQGCQICITMHEDAEALEGSALALLNQARLMSAQRRKWGILFTNYDSLAATNTDSIPEVGLWDTFFPGYFGDNDYYRRLRLAGWETIDTGIKVNHLGSQTINSDPYLRMINSYTFPLYGAYYAAKWGGSPGHETFTKAFNLESSNVR